MTVRIGIDDDRRWFLPGETISGRMTWDLDDTAASVELRLFWHTSGKGTEDVVIEREIRVDAPVPRGESAFSFEVPLEPYSFSGSLITLAWALELVALPSGELDRIELVVAPTPVEIRLESLGRAPQGFSLKLGGRSGRP